jgi:hypothetical protein
VKSLEITDVASVYFSSIAAVFVHSFRVLLITPV